MKKNFFLRLSSLMMLVAMASMISFTSCKDDDPVAEDPIASFQYTVSAENFLEVNFSNFSQNATSYSWDFGDGNTSTDENPVYTYATSGTYTVVLTASNDAMVTASFSQTLELTDPNSALALLAGETEKSWKLIREGVALGVGPDAAQPFIWWSLTNDGSRPCVFQHEFTFNRSGEFIFNDNGVFWGENAVFGSTALNEVCFEATAANMVNSDGQDVSAWLSGTHSFEYDAVAGTITLNGTGAWMGLPQLGTTAESMVPEASRTFNASIESMGTYDQLTISYTYAELHWQFVYVSYANPADEPEVVTENQGFGEDLNDFAPTAFFNTFASTDAADVSYLIPSESAVTINIGVDDPADPTAAKVGQYVRGVEQYADLKFQMDFDIQFDNFTSFSIDVYIPSSNTYAEGGLTTGIQLWIADASQTQEFWASWVQYDVDPAEIVVDQWKTYTFDLESPSEGSTGTPKTRTDLDLVGLVIGGSGHAVDGTFYIRNFSFN